MYRASRKNHFSRRNARKVRVLERLQERNALSDESLYKYMSVHSKRHNLLGKDFSNSVQQVQEYRKYLKQQISILKNRVQ